MYQYSSKKIILYVLLLLIIISSPLSTLTLYSAETGMSFNDLNWLTYNEGLVKSMIENKPTLIYFYSDQCGWCRRLEEESFSDPDIQSMMSSYFSIIKINSNSSKTILDENDNQISERELSERIFQVRGNPTIWFLDSGNERIASLPGYIPAELLTQVLVYIKDGQYRDYTFQEYMDLEKNKS